MPALRAFGGATRDLAESSNGARAAARVPEEGSVKSFAMRAAQRKARLDHALTRLVDRVRTMPDVRAIYVFGSYAAECVGPHSDLDVVIVRETELPRRQRDHDLALGFDVPVAIDALVFTPQEFAGLGEASSLGRTIVETAVRVYAT